MSYKAYRPVVTIFLISISLVLFPDSAPSQTVMCNYYASPNGTGTGVSQSSPFSISDFWSVAKPGHVLCLLDGTYTGGSSMIAPPQNLKGMSSSPITIRAFNDGKVLINGQGARTPIRLYYNDWFVIEGVNACCSNDTVVAISGGNNNIIRRVAAWDAADKNTAVFGIGPGVRNLLEDVAGWGIARKVFSSSQGGNFTTIRRAWGRWDGSHFVGPKMTYNLAYNNYDMVVENAIGGWSGQDMKETYTLLCDPGTPYSPCNQTSSSYAVDQPQGIFSNDGLSGDKNARSKLLGSIAYVQATDRYVYSFGTLLSEMDSLEVNNTVVYFAPGSNSSKYTFGLYGIYGSNASNLLAGNLTSIGGTGYSISSDWQKSNIISGASPGAIYGSGENIFNTARGANLCYRYQDGAPTKTPLWPWPMNQRIKDAMIASGRSPVDVTATIESMFGPIPSACKSTASTTNTSVVSRPSAPISLQVQRQ